MTAAGEQYIRGRDREDDHARRARVLPGRRRRLQGPRIDSQPPLLLK
jgi:hypothetical protein